VIHPPDGIKLLGICDVKCCDIPKNCYQIKKSAFKAKSYAVSGFKGSCDGKPSIGLSSVVEC